VHAGRRSVGTCGRCGNYLCEVCRTPWRGKILCTPCVDRALESGEAAPEQARAHARQAILSLCLGVAAWVLGVLLILLMGFLASNSAGHIGLVLLAMLFLMGDTLVAALGLGQAIAALRARGNHMIVATAGLILSGLFLGVFIGLFTFSVWSS
jgi:hypothetical protein